MILPSSSISILSLSFGIKFSIVISLSLAVNVNPFLLRSNLIPAKAGTKFLADKALLTLFNPSNNISFLIIIFICFTFFLLFIFI